METGFSASLSRTSSPDSSATFRGGREEFHGLTPRQAAPTTSPGQDPCLQDTLTCFMSDSTWSWGVERVVAAPMVDSITSVWTSRSWKSPSNLPMVEEI